jgi:hypothetical protein
VKIDFPSEIFSMHGYLVCDSRRHVQYLSFSGDRLNNFVVGLTNVPSSSVRPSVSNVRICGRGPAQVAAAERISVHCGTGVTSARYVTILQTSREVLTLCEVEVYGEQGNSR